MATLATSPVQALKFEILRNTEKDNPSQQPVSGYVSVAAADHDSSEILQKLSNTGIIDKFSMVYQNYAFSLLGISFSRSDKAHGDEKQEITYSFRAKDIQLEREA